MTLGTTTAASLQEWEEMPPVTLAHWQVRMVLQALAFSFDEYNKVTPSRRLPAIKSIVIDEVAGLIQATINDIALQTGVVREDSVATVSPTTQMVAAPPDPS